MAYEFPVEPIASPTLVVLDPHCIECGAAIAIGAEALVIVQDLKDPVCVCETCMTEDL